MAKVEGAHQGRPRTFRETQKYKETASASRDRLANSESAAASEKDSTPKKDRRQWAGQTVSAQEAAALDRSEGRGPGTVDGADEATAGHHDLRGFVDASTLQQIRQGTYTLPSPNATQSAYEAKEAHTTMPWLRAFKWTASEPLSATNLAPVLAEMKERLTQRNVAANVADSICESVQASLVGQPPPSGWQGSSFFPFPFQFPCFCFCWEGKIEKDQTKLKHRNIGMKGWRKK